MTMSSAGPFRLGKTTAVNRGGSVKPGKPILISGDGHVIEGDFKDLDEATQAAQRHARKSEDEVWIYAPVKKATVNDPAVSIQDVKP